MPVIRGPRNKLSRREGVDLFGGGERLQRRLNTPPGQHTRRPLRDQSEYSRQLREKQKVKRMYGMREAQFRRFFKLAQTRRGVTGEALLGLLERRLDNVIYRLGFARTRLQSRQLVNHGQVWVDDRRVTIPSFLVEPGMHIRLSPTAQRIPSVSQLLESPPGVPGWLARAGDAEGRVVREPQRAEIDADINEAAIVEFYSR